MAQNPDIEKIIADPQRGNLVANILVSACDAFNGKVNDQDVLFGLCMAVAYKARKLRAVSADVKKMLAMCLSAPIDDVPEAKWNA